MSKRITTEDFTLPLEFLAKSGDNAEVRLKVEVVAHLEDAKAFKQKFILEPSKFDISQLAAHLSELDELKDLVNAECTAYNAEYLCGDPMVATQVSEKLKEPLSRILQERGLKFVRVEHLTPVRAKPVPQSSAGSPPSMPSSASGKGPRRWPMPCIAIGTVLLIVIAGFIYYYFYTSGLQTQYKNQLSSCNSSLTSTQSQLSSCNSEVSSLQNELADCQSKLTSCNSTLQDEVVSLQSQLSSCDSSLASTRSQLSSCNSSLASTQSQLSSCKAQVTSLQSQLSSANSQIASLQNIVNLSASQLKAYQITVNQPADSYTVVTSFSVSYAGYIIVSGTSTTSNGYLAVTDSFPGYPYTVSSVHYAFGTSNSRIIPVLPGTVTVYFGNTNLFSGATATISVTYYY
jgi:flagellar biosynthesis chaperone FliJ